MAALIVLAAVAIRLALLSAVGTSLPHVTLYPAVAVAVLVGRLSAAALAAVLAALLAHLLITPFADAAALMAFLMGSSLIVAVTEALHISHSRHTDSLMMSQRNEQLRAFIEQAPVAIAMFDCDMRYLAASRHWLDFFFPDGCDVVGRSHYELLPEISERWKAGHRCALAGEVLREEEDLFARADGRIQWLCREVRPWRTARGEIGGLLIYAEDVTARVEAERFLREARDDLKRAQAVAHCGSWRVNVQRNELHWSDETYRIFGIPIGTSLSYGTFLASVHPDDRERVDAACTAALNGAPYDIEHRIHADGRTKWVRARAELELDANGQLLGGFGTVQDITDRKRAEQALRDSEDRLNLALEAGGGGSWYWDCHRNDGELSDSYRSLYGLPQDQPFGFNNWLSCVHPHDREWMRNDVEQVLRSGSQFYQEFRIIHPERGERWLRGQGRVERDHAGSPVRFFGIDVDITEAKLAETAVSQSEERLRQAVAVSNLGFFDHDHLGEVLYCSPRLKQIYGYRTDETLTFENCVATIHPDDRETITAAISRAHDPTEDGQYAVEHRVLRPDGSVRWVMKRSRTLFEGEGMARHPVRTIGAVADITEQKQLESATRDRAALADQLSKIAESAPGLICSFRLRPDGSASFPYAAASMKEVYGLDPEEVRESADPVFERTHPEDIVRVKASVATSARKLAPWHAQFRYNHPTKGEIWIEGHSSPQAEADGSILWHGFVHDVTERKRAEHELAQAKVELERRVAERTAELMQEMQRREAAQQALSQSQRLEAVGQLAGGLVHDFNNALTAISTNLELAEPRIEDRQARLDVKSALDAIEMSARLNRRLLSFARRGTGARETISVNDRIADVLRLLQRTLGPDIALKTDLAPEIWSTEIDPSELDSAILNLAINARDAMPGGGTLTIKTNNVTLDSATMPAGCDGAPGDYVGLSVEDTGIGMSPEVIKRVGEPFFTTKNPTANTGLGLSSVREFLHASGGFMTLKSRIGHGTALSLFLPRSGNLDGGLCQSLPASEIPLGDGETVLLVEDDDRVLQGTHALLEGLGYAVVTASSGPDAMAVLDRGEPVHVVFSDVVMPGSTSGVDVARRVLTERPGTKVLLTSGFPGRIARDKAAALKGVPILRKPYTRVQLAQALRTALDGQAVTVAGQSR